MRFFRGPLMEEAGTPAGTGAPAAPAAPVADAPVAPAPAAPATPPAETPQDGQSAWDSIRADAAKLQGDAPPAAEGEPAKAEEAKPPEPAAEPEPQYKELPKIDDFKPVNAREAYLQRVAQREQRTKEEQLRTQYEQQLAAERQQREAAAATINRYKQLRSEGKFDEALKLLGEENGFDGFTKEYLAHKGALPKEDPRLSEALKKLEAFETEKRQQEEQRRQQEIQARQQQEYTAMVHRVREEMEGAKEYRGVPELASVVGVPEFITQSIMNYPQQEMEWHFAVADKQFRGIFESLAPIYGKPVPAQAELTERPPVTAAATPVQPGAQAEKVGGNPPPAALPQSAAADARGTKQFESDDAEWKDMVQTLNQMSRAG